MYNSPPVTITDLFGHKSHVKQSQRRIPVDVFDLSDRFNDADRWALAAEMVKLAPSGRYGDRARSEAYGLKRCGKDHAHFRCAECGTKYAAAIKCKSRLCEPCQVKVGLALRDSIRSEVSRALKSAPRGFKPMQLTLTITSKRFGDDLPDKKGISRLYRESTELLKEHFGKWKVRRSKSGKLVEIKRRKKDLAPGDDPRVWLGRGWIAVAEVGADNNNLHIHALVFGPPVSVALLREKWEKITGDSFGVDLRLKKMVACVDYIMKYIFKPPSSDSYRRLAEWSQAIRGSRRLRTGGIFYGRIKRHKLPVIDRRCIFCKGKLLFDNILDSQLEALPMWEALLHPEKFSYPGLNSADLWLAPGVNPLEIPTF